MANLTEVAAFDATVHKISADDIVGPEEVGGADNLQAQALANRTQYLKLRADEVDAARGAADDLEERLDAADAGADLTDGLAMMFAATHYL